MKIVVGLGNPGRKYAGTRHNVGFEVVQMLAERNAGERWRNRFESETSEISLGGQRVLLVAPQLFMNLSGRSVRSVVDFFKIPLADVLVVCDDLNLNCGQLRIRASGSAGGQKGIQNIIDQLGTQAFPRLRIGIGRPDGGVSTVNYVLQTFAKSERPIIDQAVDRADMAVVKWVTDGIEATMTQFNRSEEIAGEQ